MKCISKKSSLIFQLMKIICAITKAKKRTIPINAIDPGEKNLLSE